jgi:hypothetical protein
MKTQIPSAVLDDLRTQYFAARSRGEKKTIAETGARMLGVSYATLMRKLDLRLRTRSVSHKEKARIDECNALAQSVWKFKDLKRADDKPNTLRAAHRFLQNTGQIPGWFTEKMCYDAVERLDLKNKSLEGTQRFTEFEREHPRSMYQADFTKSDYLKVVGDVIVMTNGRWSRTPGEDNSVWIGGVIDDASRVCYMEYILTPGENAMMTADFLVRAMGRKGGMPLLQAKPREMYFDRGPGFKTMGPVGVGLKNLQIKHIIGQDFAGTNITNKQARGKIEALNRHVKSDFEQSLHMEFGPGHKFTLGDLNGRLHEWCEKQNLREHPRRIGETKWGIFEQGLDEAAWLPPNALASFAKVTTAIVRRRTIRIATGEYYQAPSFIPEGARPPISVRPDGVYAEWEGSDVRLTPQSIRDPKKRAKVRKMNAMLDRSERENDTFEDMALRERFSAELQKITSGELELADLTPDQKEDLRGFFDKKRTLAEIREAVDGVKMRVLMPREFASVEVTPSGTIAQAPVVRMHPKVIQYDPNQFAR